MSTPHPEFSESELRLAISSAISWAEVLRNLGYTVSGNNRKTIRKYAALWQIDTSHFDPDAARLRGLRHRPTPLSEILVRGSTFSRGQLKARLYQAGLKDRRCEICGQNEWWRGKRFALILDHVNGDSVDNRIENLRIVCPNCAATLPTHCGRGQRKPVEPRPCAHCSEKFVARNRTQRYCSRECGQRAGRIPAPGIPRPATRKVDRPPYGQLLAEIEATSFSAVGRTYGVSDNAVRKWIRFYEREQARLVEQDREVESR